MEYQKIGNLLENTSNQPSRVTTKNWSKINDESRGGYTTGSDIKFKTTMLVSSLCDYADAYTLVKGTIRITGAGDDTAVRRADKRNKGVMFKNCALFTKCIRKKNDTETNTQHIDIVMLMYNLIQCNDSYSKTCGNLSQYYKDEPNDNSESFKSKVKITGNAPASGNTKDIKTIAPLKYLSTFWGTLEMPLVHYEVSLLTWSSTCVITTSTGEGRFTITDTKLYVPVVTLSSQVNAKLLQQIKSGFRSIFNWNKY